MTQTSTKKMPRALGLALTCGLLSMSVFAENNATVIAAHPPTPSEPERVYVDTGSASHRSTRSEEYCFYSEAHNHIHCYDEDPKKQQQQQQDRVVIIDNTVHRSTRYQHRRNPISSGISTGIGVGVAIGLPLIIHHGLHDRHGYYRNDHHYKRRQFGTSYGHSYGKSYGKVYGKAYGKDHRKKYSKGYRRGHQDDYRHGRHNRSRKYRANLP
jgi:hypothetical protein